MWEFRTFDFLTGQMGAPIDVASISWSLTISDCDLETMQDEGAGDTSGSGLTIPWSALPGDKPAYKIHNVQPYRRGIVLLLDGAPVVAGAIGLRTDTDSDTSFSLVSPLGLLENRYAIRENVFGTVDAEDVPNSEINILRLTESFEYVPDGEKGQNGTARNLCPYVTKTEGEDAGKIETNGDFNIRGVARKDNSEGLAEYYITDFDFNQTFTLSFEVRSIVDEGQAHPPVSVFFYGTEDGYIPAKRIASSDKQEEGELGDGYTDIPTTDSWERVWVTWQLGDQGNRLVNKLVLIRNDKAAKGQQIQICGLKFERGDEATSWCPAPSDPDDPSTEDDDDRGLTGTGYTTDIVTLEGSARSIICQVIKMCTSDKPGGAIPVDLMYTDEKGDWSISINGFEVANNSGASIIEDICNADNGPDFQFRPKLNGQMLSWETVAGSDANPHFEPTYVPTLVWAKNGGNCENIQVAPRGPTMRVYGTGSGSDMGTLCYLAEDLTFANRSDGWPLIETTIGDSSYETYDDLKSHTDATLKVLKNPAIQIKLDTWFTGEYATVKPGQIWPGDRVYLRTYGHPALPDGIYDLRIMEMSGDLTSKITLTFDPIWDPWETEGASSDEAYQI